MGVLVDVEIPGGVSLPEGSLADYEGSVANGMHDQIIMAVTPMVRRVLEDLPATAHRRTGT